MGCIKWNIQYSAEYRLVFKGTSCTFAMAHQPLCLLSWNRVVTHTKVNHSRIQVPERTEEQSFYLIYWTLWVFTQLIFQSWQGIVYARGKVTLTPLTNVSAGISPWFEPLTRLSALCMLEEMTLGSYTGGLWYHVNSASKFSEEQGALKQGCERYLVQLINE